MALGEAPASWLPLALDNATWRAGNARFFFFASGLRPVRCEKNLEPCVLPAPESGLGRVGKAPLGGPLRSIEMNERALTKHRSSSGLPDALAFLSAGT